MNQNEKAKSFNSLHVKGTPVVLYNAWDAGSAKAIVEAGAKAIATSSWAVSAAQGYEDGEAIPVELVERIIGCIVKAVDVPVTVDFEGGYSEDPKILSENVSRILDVGAIGINFEDRVVKGAGLYSIEKQAERIAAIRAAANKKGVNLFINARTDLFLRQASDPKQQIDAALARAKEYAAAGASGFFVPGLVDDVLIGRICDHVALPVNVMVMDGLASNERLARLRVARISYGPIPFISAMSALKDKALKVLS